MGLGVSRKIISIILSVIVAVSTAVMLYSLVVSYTFSSQLYYEKNFVTAEVAAKAEEQLEIKYRALAAESNIPYRVFETATEEYPAQKTIKNAFQNSFGAEDSTLYSANTAKYFTNLCKEYLDGSDIVYDEDDVARVGEKAARILSDTMGIHNVYLLSGSIREIKSNNLTALTSALALIVLCAILSAMLYGDRRKGAMYLLGGAYGGALGAFISSTICSFIYFGNEIQVFPDAYRSVLNGMIDDYFKYTAIISIAVFALLCALQFIVIKRYNKKSRSLLF